MFFEMSPCLAVLLAKLLAFSVLDGLSTWLGVRRFGPGVESNAIAKWFISRGRLGAYFLLQCVVFSTIALSLSALGYCDLLRFLANFLFLIIVWNFYNFFLALHLQRRRRNKTL